MIRYPIGIQDFAILRDGGYLYVDKTSHMHRFLVEGKAYFLSRPRRFGKSLLLSAFKYLFQGRKNLFEGLWIAEQTDYAFEAYPVLHFSFSSAGYKDIGLEAALLRLVDYAAKDYKITLEAAGLTGRFQELIRKLAQGAPRVVLLIDEYDKPLVDYIDQPEKADQHRTILKNFFSVLKDADAHLRFLFITGVSKFSKVSLFSDLNHLEDLTLAPYAGTLTGYTQTELESSFKAGLEQLAQAESLSLDDTLTKVKAWYNGYRWGSQTKVYNPFSILLVLKQKRFSNFWWDSGTPTFLVKLLQQDFHFDLTHIEASELMFESLNLARISWIAILFQTGYVTILDYDRQTRLYTLGYPNLEVKDTMQQHLLGAFRDTDPIESLPLLVKIKKALEQEDLPYCIDLVNVLFASLPYQVFQTRGESFFHAILHLAFAGIGMYVESEVSTAKGRVDCVVHTHAHIYVMEFKLDASADTALQQIREKQYGTRFLEQNKAVIALEVHFSCAEKAVIEWKATPYRTLLAEA